MAMLGLLSDDYGLWPEMEPRQPSGVPLPYEADMAQIARDEAARRFATGRRVSVGSRAMESLTPQPPDAALLGMLNPGAPAAAVAPAPAGAPAAASSFPPPMEAATPNFDLTQPRPDIPAAAGPLAPFPGAQSFGDQPGAMPVQGFGDAPPLPPPAAAASSTAVPPWLGMLYGATMPRMDPGGRPVPSSVPAAAPPPAPATPPSSPPPADVPDTSLAGRFGGFGDFLKGLNNWRENNRLTLMALGAGMAGAQSLGQGLNRGMTMALPAMQQDIAQQRLNATLPVLRDRLMKNGMTADEATKTAMAAVGNPTIMQQLVPGLFGAKQRKFTQIDEDFLGKKTFGFVDEVSGKVYDLTGKEVGPGGGGTTVPNGPDGQPLQGQDLLSYLDKYHPVEASALRDMYEGKMNPNARNIQKLAPLASRVWPDFDATQYPVRLATRKSYTSGKDFQETQALNTVSGHMGRLMEAADGLNNSDWKPINHAKNWFTDTFTGNPALTRFRNDLVTTQNELAKAYHGGHVSDSAYAAFNKSINEAQTPAELKTAIGEIAGLLQSKIEAKESGYRASMSGAPLPEEFRAINDEAKHSFQRIGDWAHGIAPPAVAAPARPAAPAAPAASGAVPGGHYQWTPDRGLILVQ